MIRLAKNIKINKNLNKLASNYTINNNNLSKSIILNSRNNGTNKDINVKSFTTSTSTSTTNKPNQTYVFKDLNIFKNVKRGKEGDIIHGFKVVRIRDVPERQFKTYRLEHIETGAKYLHIDCEDTNNVFSVTFKTIPKDSTGVAHILEHTTLCGSEKYPVRDPFFNMLKRSLNTYMNAWTAPDHTSYPFGTQDPKDFYNLLSVYLDATFFPLLKESDFRQEGHRLEFEQLDQPESLLKFKGIVFNEMKGALSDPSSFYAEVAQQHLYPGTTYAHNSGGEPNEIPNLTYEQLKDFHAKHYHPSNSYFFSYGDLNFLDHLKFIQENSLSKFKKDNLINTNVGKVDRWTEPKRLHFKCPPSAMDINPERKYKFSISILHKENKDLFESLTMHMLSNLLLRGSNTPMYQSLLESGLVLDYSPNTGFDDNLLESSFSVGGIGIKKEDLELVEKTIIQTLEKSAEEGFSRQVIESILHQYEFAQKDVSASFGLKLVGALASSWIHGNDPVDPLFLNESIAHLRQELDKSPFFENKIKELLANPHRLYITMENDENLQKEDTEKEMEKLKQIRSKLSESQTNEIVEMAKDLQNRQNQQQDVAVLPKINICDIEKQQPKVPHHDTTLGSTPLRILDLPTNGISYFRSTIDISSLSPELKPYVPLFCSLIDEMGAGEFDHKQLDTEMNLYIGKFSVSPLITIGHSDLNHTQERIYIKGACLNENLVKMFSLLQKVLLENKWKNPDLLKNLIGQKQASLVEGIPSSGLSYAKTLSSSKFTRAGELSEQWNGLTHVKLINDIVSKNDMDSLISKLLQINEFILDRSLMKCLITTEGNNVANYTEKLNDFMKVFSYKNTEMVVNTKKPVDPTNDSRFNFFPIPATVNYISKTLQSVPYTHQDSAPIQILTKVLSEYLHKEIREKGGAYGGGVSADGGIISFYSYRDPNLDKTLNAFNQSIHWSLNNNITTETIENAQLSIFSDFDSPESPSNKGVGEWMRDITDEMKQTRRNNLLSINKPKLEEISKNYLLENNNNYVTVLGSKDSSDLNKFNIKQITV
ncbi:hypothetical protein DICPUDRAFT_158791 [Dictyostelium purpureum]|uniref:Presequence protease, mitochondrial n=1 Tax=Dictyostelium purpureum TaxID=5786 RepID=F1A2H7_DICPU|nr:uncharacterized protein DICPUDRAFT_158791 [Dictyostelium purpureum]EGC29605.1 hypothetical protein DICPUDRAFT_158791 [Dictyostelium purpureum]|eukprot:XP_003293873.1 hypothetical protein DICPUDRAFT_158791 [Dictyostelium purpureum]